MRCPKCGNELTRSQKNPEFGLCYNCKLKFRWKEEISLPEPEVSVNERQLYTTPQIHVEQHVTTPAPVQNHYYNTTIAQDHSEESYFDGGLLQLIGWKLLGSLITAATFGICYPWACCMIYDWETKHTVVNGHRLKFTGTAMQLFGLWIKWWLFCLVTCGIYGFWVAIDLKKWKTKHTEFAD